MFWQFSGLCWPFLKHLGFITTDLQLFNLIWAQWMSCYTLKKIFGRNRQELSYDPAFVFHHNLSFIWLFFFFCFSFSSSTLSHCSVHIHTDCHVTLSGPIKYHSIKEDHLYLASTLSACITSPGRGMDIYQGF